MTDQNTAERENRECRVQPSMSSRDALHRKLFEPVPNSRPRVNPFDLRQPSLLRWVPTRASQNTK